MIKTFVEKVAQQKLAVKSIIITQGNRLQSHFFQNDALTSLRSISKVISCLGVYKAINHGMFDLQTKVIQFFPEVVIDNISNLNALNNLTIEHLLTLRMGHEQGLLFSKDVAKLPADTDLLGYVFNYEMPYQPGEHFIYNNAATYVLAAIVQKLSHKNFSEWINETIFKPLNIDEYYWENSKQGICLGASGLWLRNSDLHKVAQLLLDAGQFNEKEIVEAQWINNMLTPHVYVAELPEYASKQSRSINKVAYGYHIWLCGDGTVRYPKTHYFCDGTDGQFLIVSPKKNMAITILSSQKDMSPLYPIIGDLI